MNNYQKLLGIILILVWVVQSTAQNIYHITDNKQIDTISKFFLHAKGKQDIRQINLHLFKSFNYKVKQERNTEHWFVLDLVNTTPQTQNYFIRFRSTSAWRLNFIHSYLISSKTKDTIYVNCSNLAKQSELVNTNQREKFLITINAGDTIRFFSHIYNISGHPPYFETIIEPVDYENKIESRVHSFHMFYEGMMWLVIIYNFLVFLVNKDRAYFFYSLYILCSAVYTLFFYRYLLNSVLTEQPMLDPYFWLVFLLSGPIFYLLFLNAFVQLRTLLSNKWILLIKVAIAIQGLFLVAMVVLYTTTYNAWLINTLVGYVLMAVIFFNALVITRLLFTKQTKVYYFAAASVLLWVGFFTGNFLYISGNAYAQIYGEIGVIGEMILLSMGMGHRMRENELLKQKAQSELINQLEENRQLQEKVNRELEDMVKERTAEIMMQKHELEAQSEEIYSKNQALSLVNNQMTDSIRYASYIQKAIFTSPEVLKKHFNEAFVLLKPHSLVSGDFYWFTTANSGTETFRILIVADCTGHGVPGAFMTVMGSDFLDEIVRLGVVEPELILELLDQKLLERFTIEGNKSKISDGMDLGVLTINDISGEMQFSGAHTDLLVVRKNEIQLTRGANASIGGKISISDKKFVRHTLKFLTGDIIYMYSDGFYDQFGGENYRKYQSGRFREFLLSISNLPMDEQYKKLEMEHATWKGQHKQTDDILVVGVKL